MDLASAEAEIRHVFGFTSITEANIGAAPPGNNIAQCSKFTNMINLEQHFAPQQLDIDKTYKVKLAVCASF